MAFGPESNNPRERRAYAHTMINKLSLGEVNFGEALQAAYKASLTSKGESSGFQGALTNATEKVVTQEKGSSGHRKIRRVPLDWQHPKDKDGYFIPLFDTRETASGKYTLSEIDEMITEGFVGPNENMKEWFMPVFKDIPAEEMGICLYETTTEGTPLTPVFPDSEQGYKDLASFAEDNNITTFADNIISGSEWEDRFIVTKPKVIKPINEIDQTFRHGMADPHYSDERFEGSKPLTTFLAEGYELDSSGERVDGNDINYLYFDRLLTSTRHDESGAFEAAKRVEGGRSKPLFYQEYLKTYFDDEELELVHVLAGVQAAGNGMPYWALGFKSPVLQAELLQEAIDDIPF